MIPPRYLDELKARVSLPELIGRRVTLARNGNEWVGLCPFHNERTPSFNVVPAKGWAHCFGCGWHGNAIHFVMRADGVDFIEAVGRLADGAGMARPYGLDDEGGGRPAGAAPAVDNSLALAHERERTRQSQVEAMKREEARAIWLAGRPIERGDPVWRYLLGRSIDLALVGRVPGALRFHPRCWHKKLERHFPAMVAAVSDDSAEAGGHLATHCTFLQVTADAVMKIPAADKRLQRRCYGSYRGGSIKLTRGASGKPWRQAPPGDKSVSGEGIEDTLTGAMLLPTHRSFAGVSGGNYKNILLPGNIGEVVLLYQNDHPRKADGTPLPNWWDRAAAHFHAQGRKVGRLRPPVFVKDINEFAQWARRVGETAAARVEPIEGELGNA